MNHSVNSTDVTLDNFSLSIDFFQFTCSISDCINQLVNNTKPRIRSGKKDDVLTLERIIYYFSCFGEPTGHVDGRRCARWTATGHPPDPRCNRFPERCGTKADLHVVIIVHGQSKLFKKPNDSQQKK